MLSRETRNFKLIYTFYLMSRVLDWKVGSSKLLAVLEDELRRQKKEKPVGAKHKLNKANNDIIDNVIESTSENLLDEITDAKKDISKYHQLAFKHRFSLSFIASFEDAFQCSIC